MEKAKVYYTDFRTVAFGDGLPTKLKKLIKKAGIGQMDMDGKFVAIKMHFGELGNISFLRPNYARAVVDVDVPRQPQKRPRTPLLCVGERLHPADGRLSGHHRRRAQGHGRYRRAGCGRRIREGGAHRPRHHGCGRVHQPDPLQGARDDRLWRHDQEHRHGLRFPRGQDRAALQRQAEHRRGRVPRVPTLPARVRQWRDHAHCVGCGRCLGACNFDAISFDECDANERLNARMAEYTKAVIDGRPNFHISLIVDVSPNCDCHCENDAPILPNIGMFASFDPLALDQACVDACMAANPMPNSQLSDNMKKPGFADWGDPFRNSRPESEWRSCLEHAEKIGLGTREYELIKM